MEEEVRIWDNGKRIIAKKNIGGGVLSEEGGRKEEVRERRISYRTKQTLEDKE